MASWIRKILPPMQRLKRMMPRGIFARTILIIVLPTILTNAVATYVFFDRHWSTVTNRLSQAVAGDIALVVDLMASTTKEGDRAEILHLAGQRLSLAVSFSPNEKLPRRKKRFTTPLHSMVERAMRERISYPFTVDTRHSGTMIAVRIEAPKGLYTVLFPARRVYSPTTEIFIMWMLGSSILLSAVALLFMRNQVRPIRRLAQAAEAMGKGQDAPWFKPSGAVEVRQATAALFVMQDRVRRQVNQRTTMLAGISHDLRTPLTRMKLQLALMPDSTESQEFKSDIADMEMMVDSYLAFARGEEGEAAAQFDMADLVREIVTQLSLADAAIEIGDVSPAPVCMRRNAIKRCLMNLANNALRYGGKARLALSSSDKMIEITVDDAGPGIPPDKREDVFKPFLRLDESRNRDTGGTGLGLSIARDIARSHGGDVALEDSPLGGLRARVWIPR